MGHTLACRPPSSSSLPWECPVHGPAWLQASVPSAGRVTCSALCTWGRGVARLPDAIPGGEQCAQVQQQGRGGPLGMGPWHWGAASPRAQWPGASLRNLVAPSQHLLRLGTSTPPSWGR